MIALRERWLTKGRSCEPIDRLKVKDALCAMYRAQKEDEPIIFYFPSPFQCVLAHAILTKLGANLWANLSDNLGANLRANLGGLEIPNYFGGNQWCAWEVFYDFCNQIGVPYSEGDRKKLDLWLEQSEECHWWFPFKGIILASDRPEKTSVNAQGRLHSLDGPAIQYRDGWGLWAVNGVRVARYIVEAPEEITVEKIEVETNAEVRRVMVDRYLGGMAKYVLDSKADVVHKDEFGTLYRKAQEDDEDIWMVHVVCPSTQREYFLGVDPNAYGGLKTARAAVASTWRNKDGALTFAKPEDYFPLVET